MRLLAAAAGTDPDDFAYSTLGELVMLAPNCSRAEAGDTDECGCSKTFAGLSSHLGTTVATVVELDIDLDTLTTLVVDSIERAGWDVDQDDARAIAEEMATLAEDLPVGTVVRRSFDEVILE